MEIKHDRMVHLGYGKYWRSDEIVGLVPIEEGRGPGRRTEVYVATLAEPVLAARTEETILADMAGAGAEGERAAEALSAARELLEELRRLSPMLRRMLRNEGGMDVDRWTGRLERLVEEAELDDQEDLFHTG